MHRSALMVAGDKQKHLDKLPGLKCDIAIINLEDGVFDKDYARKLLIKNFSSKGLKFDNIKTVIRVNDLQTYGKEDIKTANTLKPDGIRVAKIKTVNDVQEALELIDKDIEVHLSIETKEAFDNLKTLKVDERVTTVYLGILDLLESLGLPQSLMESDNPTIEYILSKFLIDSKTAGFIPLSFTYQEHNNLEQFRLWCEKDKKMGFGGKNCISPKQVEIANEIFAMDKTIIEKAKYIVNVFEKQFANGCTGFEDEKYGFIDEPIYKDALLILSKVSLNKN